MEKEDKYKGSKSAYSSCVDYTLIPTDVTTTASLLSPVYPENTSILDEKSPITIRVPSSSSMYTALNESYLYIKCAIKNTDGTDLAENTEIAFCENAFASLFESCNVEINSTVVTKRSANLYQYQYYLENFLGTSPLVKTSSMTSEMFYEDVGSTFTNSNTGYLKRKKLSAKSKSVELIGRISSGITTQSRYLPPNTQVTFVLRRSPAVFSLVGRSIAGKNCPYQIEFQKIVYYVKRYTVNPLVTAKHLKIIAQDKPTNTIMAHDKRLNFPIIANEMRVFNVSVGSKQILSDSLFNGPLPNFIVIAILQEKAMNGDLTISPFKFVKHGLEAVNISVDGVTNQFREIPCADDETLLAYKSLLDVIPKQNHGITKDDFDNSKFLVAMRLTPAYAEKKFNLSVKGQVRLALTFSEPTKESFNVLVFGQFTSLVQIGRSGRVISDQMVIG